MPLPLLFSIALDNKDPLHEDPLLVHLHHRRHPVFFL